MEHGNTKKKIERNEKQKEKAERERAQRVRMGKEERSNREKNILYFHCYFFKVVLSLLLFIWKTTKKNYFQQCSFLEFLQIMLSTE